MKKNSAKIATKKCPECGTPMEQCLDELIPGKICGDWLCPNEDCEYDEEGDE